MAKKSYPLSKVYGLLEPGPVVLITTASGDRTDIMAQSWHTMIEFEPPLVGCVVSNRNYSFDLLQASGECVINIPSIEIAEQVVGLTPKPAKFVSAPLIDECFANLECRVSDTTLVAAYGLFIVEVIHAWIDPAVKDRRTLHHLGQGHFMVAGERIKLKSKMK
jgi:flavin reductase (DIM6/NTAB) family NADH-FMN oxidoreductase RutF